LLIASLTPAADPSPRTLRRKDGRLADMQRLLPRVVIFADYIGRDAAGEYRPVASACPGSRICDDLRNDQDAAATEFANTSCAGAKTAPFSPPLLLCHDRVGGRRHAAPDRAAADGGRRANGGFAVGGTK
jgi:hypothetical protein